VTLYLTPVFYIYMSALQTWVTHWKGKKPATAPAGDVLETVS